MADADGGELGKGGTAAEADGGEFDSWSNEALSELKALVDGFIADMQEGVATEEPDAEVGVRGNFLASMSMPPLPLSSHQVRSLFI